ncbi:MAG: ATP-dependent zinc metalloprotease FtsH [candidate division KSB1 bacterium]|nr:ATP-dependent zinc metalloprotease FtsH [candidate division KSB1 bacterium]
MPEKQNKKSKNQKTRKNSSNKPTPPPPPQQAGPVSWIRVVFFAIIVYLILQWAFGSFDQSVKIPYSSFKTHLQENKITQVTVRGSRIQGSLKNQAQLVNARGDTVQYSDFVTFFPKFGDEKLMSMLEENQVTIATQPERDTNWWTTLLIFAPLIFLGLIFYSQYKRMQGGGSQGGLFSIGKSRAKLHTVSKEDTTFEDVAGAESAKEELQEVVSYLKEPERIQKLGGKIPSGMLLLGPPGCGKTLLARAVAGEAGVPFFSITGSDFMEMFVGVGASRVRDLFEQAKKNAPSIIFIDELDSIGRQRGAGLGGGHDEREQTLNQLLSEMDGFEPNESVIAMAATNRPDILDSALRRPGRFDRQVIVPAPKLKDRLEILKMYADRKTMADDVNLEQVAKSTPGFSGADLENLLNEAALMAGRKNKSEITQQDVDQARDKVMMGLTRRGLVLSDEEKKMIAYHEAGHAVSSVILTETHPVHKISIIPRTRAMGVTEQFPEEEKYVYKKEYMLDQLSVMMGGRAAEELFFNTATTGAENDLKQATQLARRMVLEWGMSDKFQNIALGQQQGQVFLGQQLSQKRDFSESTAYKVDKAVQELLKQAHDRTRKVLENRRKVLDKVVKRLLEDEEIAGEELDEIIENDGE